MKLRVHGTLFAKFFWTLTALGTIPMAISTLFLYVTYESRIRHIVDEDVARELQLNSGIQFLLIFLFVLIMATFAAYIISRNISRPLFVLTEVMKRIAGGNLNIQIRVRRQDEIGDLGNFVNEMVRRVKEARERQEEISAVKSEFISVAAHQLRTPLSIEKWAYNLLLDGDVGKVTPKQRELLEKAVMANESMIRLVHNLLDAARIEEGKFGYTFQKMDFVPFLKKLLQDRTVLLREKKINLVVQHPLPRDLFLTADEERLSIAIGNIVDNAIRYTASGGLVEISVDTAPPWVTVAVRDTGIGITKEDKDRLFTKFYRGSNVMHIATEGTGLGLFLAKNIVIAHGGEIWFRSRETEGTTFFIKLPLEFSPKSPSVVSHDSFVGSI